MKFLILLLVLFFVGCSEPDLAPHFTENRDAGVDAGHDADDLDHDSDDLDHDADDLDHDSDDLDHDSDDLDHDSDPDEPGECADNPCDELIEHPQCRQATCDDLLGCSFQNIRESLPCEAPGIRDGRCQSGQCVGTICTCDAETECCDGCLPMNDGAACDDGDEWTIDTSCSSGSCVGTPCDCLEGECCDGCFFVAEGTICDDDRIGERRECYGHYNRRIFHVYAACSGESSECSPEHTAERLWLDSPCPDGKVCTNDYGACNFEL